MIRGLWVIVLDIILIVLSIVCSGAEPWLMFVVAILAGIGIVYTIHTVNGSRIERRWRAGLCVRCGYQLYGNVSGTCPECGNKIASMSQSQ